MAHRNSYCPQFEQLESREVPGSLLESITAAGMFAIHGSGIASQLASSRTFSVAPTLRYYEQIQSVSYVFGQQYWVDIRGSDGGILLVDISILPAGDGASIPTWVPGGSTIKMIVDRVMPEVYRLHDYLYSNVGQQQYGLSRLQADQILRDMMTVRGYERLADVFFTAVRIGGSSYWE